MAIFGPPAFPGIPFIVQSLRSNRLAGLVDHPKTSPRPSSTHMGSSPTPQITVGFSLSCCLDAPRRVLHESSFYGCFKEPFKILDVSPPDLLYTDFLFPIRGGGPTVRVYYISPFFIPITLVVVLSSNCSCSEKCGPFFPLVTGPHPPNFFFERTSFLLS